MTNTELFKDLGIEESRVKELADALNKQFNNRELSPSELINETTYRLKKEQNMTDIEFAFCMFVLGIVYTNSNYSYTIVDELIDTGEDLSANKNNGQ